MSTCCSHLAVSTKQRSSSPSENKSSHHFFLRQSVSICLCLSLSQSLSLSLSVWVSLSPSPLRGLKLMPQCQQLSAPADAPFTIKLRQTRGSCFQPFSSDTLKDEAISTAWSCHLPCHGLHLSELWALWPKSDFFFSISTSWGFFFKFLSFFFHLQIAVVNEVLRFFFFSELFLPLIVLHLHSHSKHTHTESN